MRELVREALRRREAAAEAPPGAHQRAGRMAGYKPLKINRKSPPRGEAAGRGCLNIHFHPAIRRGHSPAGGAPNAIAGAP